MEEGEKRGDGSAEGGSIASVEEEEEFRGGRGGVQERGDGFREFGESYGCGREGGRRSEGGGVGAGDGGSRTVEEVDDSL